jgi:hypothetical protein
MLTTVTTVTAVAVVHRTEMLSIITTIAMLPVIPRAEMLTVVTTVAKVSVVTRAEMLTMATTVAMGTVVLMYISNNNKLTNATKFPPRASGAISAGIKQPRHEADKSPRVRE